MFGLFVKVGFLLFIGILFLWAVGEFMGTKLGRVVQDKTINKLNSLLKEEENNGNNNRR